MLLVERWERVEKPFPIVYLSFVIETINVFGLLVNILTFQPNMII